jgi:uncharacterized protein
MENSIFPGKEKNLIKRYPLPVFFGLAYVFFFLSLLIIGGIAMTHPISPLMLKVITSILSWAPNIAAFLVVWTNQGPAGIRNLFAGWLRWRVPVGWYLFGLIPLVAAFAVAGGGSLLGCPSPGVGTGITGAALFSMVLFNLTQGATGEELGWRGFALPRLQARYSLFISALILGLLIAGWHSILHLVAPTGVPEWQFWLILVCYSVVVAWSYNHSGGSLLIVTLFHFSFNFGIELVTTRLGLISIENLFWGYVGVYLLLALGVIGVEGGKFWRKPVVSG